MKSMYWLSSSSIKVGPLADLKKTGLPLTFLNALTGEFTPPGISVWACSKRDSDLFLFKGISFKTNYYLIFFLNKCAREWYQIYWEIFLISWANSSTLFQSVNSYVFEMSVGPFVIHMISLIMYLSKNRYLG